MTSDISDIFSRFYLRVEDYNLAGLNKNLAEQILNGYLKAAVSQPYIRKLYTSIVADEDVGEVEYSMREPIDDLSDMEFTEEMLALAMVVQWLSPKFHTVLNTSQILTNSDQKFYSQANHMAGVQEMYTKAQVNLRKYIRDRGYVHGYVNGTS